MIKGKTVVKVEGQTYFILKSVTRLDYQVFRSLRFSEFGGDRIIEGDRCEHVLSKSPTPTLLSALQIICMRHPNA